MSNACSAASGLWNAYVELRNTAGRADPTDSVGSNPCVRTLVVGRSACGARRSFSSDWLELIGELPHHRYSMPRAAANLRVPHPSRFSLRACAATVKVAALDWFCWKPRPSGPGKCGQIPRALAPEIAPEMEPPCVCDP